MKQKIESSLERSMRQLPHPSFEAIAQAHVPPMQAHDYITRQECPPKQRRVWLHALVCAAVVLVVGAGWFFQYRMVDAVIDLDVNPSFEITTNRNEQVLDVRGINAQAREVLQGRIYRGWALEDTLDTLFTDLNESGYVNGQQNAVLVSVAGRDAQHTQELKAIVTQRITDTLTARDVQPDIIQQDLHTREAVTQQPQENGVSDGKLQLIDRLCAQDPSLSQEALIPMSITQLRALAQEQGFDLGTAKETQPSSTPVSTVTPSPTVPTPSSTPTLTPAPMPTYTPIPVIREDIYDDDGADDEEKDDDEGDQNFGGRDDDDSEPDLDDDEDEQDSDDNDGDDSDSDDRDDEEDD